MKRVLLQRFPGLRARAAAPAHVSAFEVPYWGLGFRVWGLGFRV